MKLAVASGKGGTGKTTLAVALALAAGSATLLDCDVEEPNVHLFLAGEQSGREPVSVLIPQVDMRLCDACRCCIDFCQFNALAVFPGQTLVFPELCHSCGGCQMVCPRQAITEVPRRIGELIRGKDRDIDWIQGRLDVGQAMSPPLIWAVLSQAGPALTIIDSPPGTSCPMVAAVADADYVLLVTEPTPFGLNDLSLAVATLRQLKRRYGVIVNRADSGDDGIEDYCEREGIRVWLRIPMNRRIAELYSNGGSLLDAMPEYRDRLAEMLEQLAKPDSGGTA